MRPDGQVRWVRSTTAPVFAPDGKLTRTAGTVEDITDRKLAETAAAKANAAKTELLSRTSHELRTPLNAILGFAQLLELDRLQADQKDFVQQILSAGWHLVGLVDDVLDIAEIENNKLDLLIEAVPIVDLLSESVQSMMPVAAAAQVTIDFCPPEPYRAQSVCADRHRLGQVILTLLSNAVKYNRPGGRVEVHCETRDPLMLDIAVTDTGRGIDSEDLLRLFTPFERLAAPVAGIDGTGLGLTLSHKLMATMGGDLQARSEPDVGSTFTVSIPMVELVPVMSGPPG